VFPVLVSYRKGYAAFRCCLVKDETTFIVIKYSRPHSFFIENTSLFITNTNHTIVRGSANRISVFLLDLNKKLEYVVRLY